MSEIRAPGPRLLRSVQLSFVQASSRARRSLDAPIALVPFIDLLLTVVVFLLMTFSASNGLDVSQLPEADHGNTLDAAPIVAIDTDHVLLDGRRMASSRTLTESTELERIEPLVQDLDTLRRNHDVLHPNEPFAGRLIVQAGRDVDFRVVRKVLFSAGQSGYGAIQLAVRER